VLIDKIFRIQVTVNPSNPPKPEESKAISTLSPTDTTNIPTEEKDLDADDHCIKRGRGCRGKNREWKKNWNYKKEKWGRKDRKDHCDNEKGGRNNRMDHCDNEGSGESGDENLSLDDIKKEVSSLTEELKILVEKKKKKIKEELGGIKNKITEGRRDSEMSKETIIAMRDGAVKKRQELRVLFVQIKNSKARIQKLRSIAVTKTE